MNDKDKAAPVGEREAFEAWFFCPSNSLLAEWEDAAWEAFQDGAAYQRQVHAEHEGPDYGDGPEFEGWAERSGQQLQSAEAVAFEVKNPNTGRVKLYRGSKEHLMVGFALAGYIVRPLYTTPQPSAVPDGWKLVPVERITIALESVQNAMEDAYNNAYQECCGLGQGQCCGDPVAAWSDADTAIMDALAPAQLELSALLAAAPSAPATAQGGKTVHDLLAVIHRDGGHYEHEHGTGKALADAMEVVNKERVEADDWRHAAPSAPKADERPLYTCIGKGGEYRYLGTAIGAGDSRGELAEVYQDRTGQLFHRTPEDFMERMEPIAATRKEGGKV